MAEYYRTIFTIEGTEEKGLVLLDHVEENVRHWYENETGRPFGAWKTDYENFRFGTDQIEDQDLGRFWSAWERSPDDDPETRWRLGLRLSTEGDDIEADIEVRGIEDAISSKLGAEPPGIVSVLLSGFNCSVDGRRLLVASRRVTSEDADSFIEILLSPQRSLPLIVVSEDSSGSSAIDPDELQRMLLGLTSVYLYDHDVAWYTSKDLPRSLRCYDGAIRLYSPRCTAEDVPQQHPYWEPGDVVRLSGERMLSILHDECMNRLPRQGRRRVFARVRSAVNREERAFLEESVEMLEKQQGNEDSILSEIIDEDLSLDIADAEGISIAKYNARGKIARAFRNRNMRLQEELRQLKESAAAGGYRLPEIDVSPDDEPVTTESTHEFPDAAEEPAQTTVLEVVEQASGELEGLRFFQSAFDSARQVSTGGRFTRLEDFRKTFECMSACAEKRSTGLGLSLEHWFKLRGVEYAKRESETTSARFSANRRFIDDLSGEHVSMQEHFKLNDGSFHLRVHVSWDKRNGSWLVGHVGEHLPTSSDPH